MIDRLLLPLFIGPRNRKTKVGGYAFTFLGRLAVRLIWNRAGFVVIGQWADAKGWQHRWMPDGFSYRPWCAHRIDVGIQREWRASRIFTALDLLW